VNSIKVKENAKEQMNIFILDDDMQKCTHAMIDRHIVKMPLEYAQILSTVCRAHGWPTTYEPTHINHPCVKWAQQSLDNYRYLWDLAMATGLEYTRRFGREHLSTDILFHELPYIIDLPLGDLTPFAQCMPEEYRQEDPIEAYRAYYMGEKSQMASWKHGSPPAWWNVSVKRAPRYSRACSGH